jgi:transposase
MGAPPPIPDDLWEKVPPEAQAAIQAVIRSFERRIAAWEERLGRNSTNSSRPPSSDPPSVKRRPPAAPSGKRRGGQPGHPRRCRPLVPPEQLRQVVDVKPPACRCCGHELRGVDPDPKRHQVAELPPIRPVVDEYRLHRLACPRCGTTTGARLPRGVPAGAFGPRLRAALGLLAGAYRLRKRLIRLLAHDLLGLSISTGMIAKLERRSAEELQGPVQELRAAVRRAASAHIDETSWRERRRKAWLWVARTASATAYTIAP